ncbi:ABC transporter ATP-binding protein [Erythrobacter sp. NE805]|uniref:ABC transporter ATP-binding protein n=1 Tax=Erythrobacter sp. NE805 TaxID=3389875 RepID=UPI00396AFF01
MSTPLVELAGITKLYDSGPSAFAALKGVDLSIPRGRFVAVMGPSGSGKSTTMNIIGCLDRPSAGEYFLEGEAMVSLTNDERALIRRRAIGFIFQGFNLLARTNAARNVELPLLYRGDPKPARRKAALEALALVGLEQWWDHTPAELSGGQQQRVAIARALVTNPRLLLADEPTGNLDSARSQEIMEILVRLNRERGITIVMVTHEPEMAAYADLVVHFADGLIARIEDRR